ncbi:MAG: O-antigen ligase family protein [Patescibacteria group bacterium]
MKNILLKNKLDIWYILVLFFITIPLERIGSFGLAGFTVRLSQIIILGLLCFYFWSLVKKEQREVVMPYPIVLYVIFLCAGLVSLITAKEQMRGLFILIFDAFMISVPVVIVWLVDTRKKLEAIIAVLVYISVVVCAFGFFQFFGDLIGLPQALTGLSDRYVKIVVGIPRIQSTFIEPLYLANFLVFPLMATAFLSLKKKQPKRIQYFAFSVIFFLAIVLTLSKGGIAVTIALLLGVVVFYFRSVFSKKNIPYFIALAVLIAGLGWGILGISQRALDLNKNITKAIEVLTGGSVRERQEASDTALQAFYEHPVTGIGVGNFGPYYAGYPTQAPDYGWAITNNEFLEVLAEMGILGLTLFILFLGSIFYRSIYLYFIVKDEFTRLALIATLFALVGVFIQYFTFSTLYIMHIWVLIGITLAAQNIAQKEIDSKSRLLQT